jgi:hypothetical protein
MKTIASALVLALALVCFVSPQLTNAGSSGPSANGSFQLSSDEGLTSYVVFDVRTDKNGQTSGEMTFSNPLNLADEDVDGVGAAVANDDPSGFFMKANFDCLTINGNRAVMSGVVTDSNVGNYIGRRALLVVEDNGEGLEDPDKLTWGLYQPAGPGWIASDAELEVDPGVGMQWMVKDAEREEDPEVPSTHAQNKAIGCQSFPLSSYSFIDINHGAGNVQVKP